jgi:hypothetical protein
VISLCRILDSHGGKDECCHILGYIAVNLPSSVLYTCCSNADFLLCSFLTPNIEMIRSSESRFTYGLHSAMSLNMSAFVIRIIVE